MAGGKMKFAGLLGIIALVTTIPFVVVARQISPGDGTPVPVTCNVTPRPLSEILTIGSGGPVGAIPVASPVGATPKDSKEAATPVVDDGFITAVERTVMGAAACRDIGDALRYFSYYTDTFIAEQFAVGALSDESLLRFGETSTASKQRVVAIQSVRRFAEGSASAIVLTTSSPTSDSTTEGAILLVDEFAFVNLKGAWQIDQIRRLAHVSVANLIVTPSTITPTPPHAEESRTPTIVPALVSVELSSPGIAWSTNEIAIARGGTIHLVNDGSGGPHNFAIEGFNDDELVDMPPGSETDWVVPEDFQPGTYTFYCSIPGHRQAGMEGTITILAGSL